MTDMAERIMTMTEQQREGAIAVLDSLTRPLTVREIEHALQRRGVTRSRSVIMAASIKDMHVVALVGGERG